MGICFYLDRALAVLNPGVSLCGYGEEVVAIASCR
jgi:hypothetical protein